MQKLVGGIGYLLSGIGMVNLAFEHLEGFMFFTITCVGVMLAIVGLLNLLSFFTGNKQDNEDSSDEK